MIALKTILKEIDPYAFEEALKMKPEQRKIFRVKQDEDERHNYDAKWTQLDAKLISGNSDFEKPLLPFAKDRLIRDYN